MVVVGSKKGKSRVSLFVAWSLFRAAGLCHTLILLYQHDFWPEFVFTLHLTGHYISIFLTMSLWITWTQNHRMGIIISKYSTQMCPGVEPSVDTKRGQWMLSHTHAHVQIWLLHPLSLNLILKSESKSNLSQSCSCLCPEEKSLPMIHATGEKLTWED